MLHISKLTAQRTPEKLILTFKDTIIQTYKEFSKVGIYK